MAMASKYRSFLSTVVYSFVLSLTIELSQLFMKVGCFDVDDLLLNTMGGMIGFVAFSICNVMRRNYAKKKK
jgi:glycopeptide antibiotics resistance protein